MNELPAPAFLDALERKYAARAFQEIEARKCQGEPVTPAWLNELEEKYLVMARQELAQVGDGKMARASTHVLNSFERRADR